MEPSSPEPPATPLRLPRKGEEVEVVVRALGERGHAVAEIAGRTLRLKGAAPGDRVRARVLRRGRRGLEARLLERLEAGPAAADPRCPHAGTCGGCSFQAVAYDAQLEAKRRWIEEALAGGGLARVPEVAPVLGMEEPWHYRNKMDFSFASRRWVEEQEPEGVDASFALGLHVPGRWDKVLDLQACSIAFPEAEGLVHTARRLAREQDLDPWDVHAARGLLRHLVVRKGLRTGEILVDLVTDALAPERVEPFVAGLLEAHPEVTTLVQGVTARAAKVAQHDEERVHHGPGFIREVLAGRTFEISPTSFFQTNTLQAERLVGVVAEEAGLRAGERLLDLYCGAGTLGLCLAGSAEHELLGFEVVEPAVQDARRNARANGVEHARFEVGDVRDVLVAQAHGALPPSEVVVVDPPRAGLHPEVPAALAALGARRVVYVSCNPRQAVGDLLRLEGLGWETVGARPLDLFPHTPHTECVFTLEPR
jgi:23S rRNA (uracil1939-C5)-methyltransferase